MKEYLISCQEKDEYVWKKTSILVKGHIREYNGLVFGISYNGNVYNVTELYTGYLVKNINKLKYFNSIMIDVDRRVKQMHKKWEKVITSFNSTGKSLNPQYTTSNFYKEIEKLKNG